MLLFIVANVFASIEWLTPVLAVVGVLGSGLITYLVSHRTHSGDIKQTPAEKLWDAAESIRGELVKEVEHQRQENLALRSELLLTNQRLASAEAEIRELKARMTSRGE